MKNAHTAGKSDSPTTIRIAGPANAQPVSGPRQCPGRDADAAGPASGATQGHRRRAGDHLAAFAIAASDFSAASSSASCGSASPCSTLAIAVTDARDISS